MTHIKTLSTPVYMTIDCEFTEEGFVRELVLVLFNNHQVVRVLEVLLSPSGAKNVQYKPLQTNYHLSSADQLNLCIDSFLQSCLTYAPLENIKLVGMSLEHDLKSILNTTKSKSLLNTILQKTQLEMCGRGTLETKATNYAISSTQINKVLDKIVTPRHRRNYKYHTALYDAIVTGYVYLKVVGHTDPMSVHNRFRKCRHTYFKAYYSDLSALATHKKQLAKSAPPEQPQPSRIPKNFPELRYKVQKNLSNVFDIVPREIFHRQLIKLYYEPSLRKIDYMKAAILEQVHPVKLAVSAYDSPNPLTDPYNIALIDAGVLLVQEKISIEEFIDFAIYMQQYNLPPDKGNYYKVSNGKRELFVRCLKPCTAKKLLYKHPYCTIDQFLRKKVPDCHLEELQ